VNEITGIKLANESNTAWTKEFMSLVSDITESAAVTNSKDEINHILLDLSDFNDVDTIDGYLVVFRNSSNILFSKV